MNWDQISSIDSNVRILQEKILAEEIPARFLNSSDSLSLELNGLILQVYDKYGITFKATIPAERTVIPEDIQVNCYQLDSPPMWKNRILSVLKIYKENLWKDRTEAELIKFVKKDFLLVKMDALQELAKRLKTKTAFLEKMRTEIQGTDYTKCEISNLWIDSNDYVIYHYYLKSFNIAKEIKIFKHSSKRLASHFVEWNNLLIEKDQVFVSTIDWSERHGSMVFDQKHIPLWYFKKEYEKATCGHYAYKPDIRVTLCPKCIKEISPTGRILNSYNTRAPEFLKFQGGDVEKPGKFSGSTTYYGFELELENGGENDAILMYAELKDFLLCKIDGSLHSGFEIVSTPATYEVHKNKAEMLFTIIKTKTKMEAKETCGLHFHVSKDSLTTMQIGKQLDFIYNPQNYKFITEIAGRSNSSFGKLKEVEKNLTSIAPENFNIESTERYEAINLRNARTIEFRLFASTTKYEVFMHRLDFVKALCDYTKPCAVNVKNLNELKDKDTFIKFLESNKKDYPFLIQFLGMKTPIPTSQEIELKRRIK